MFGALGPQGVDAAGEGGVVSAQDAAVVVDDAVQIVQHAALLRILRQVLPQVQVPGNTRTGRRQVTGHGRGARTEKRQILRWARQVMGTRIR